MRILLVQPYAGYEKPNILMKLSAKLPVLPNLTLQQLAASCPPDSHLEAIDENRGDKIKFDKEYDIVGISCRTAAVPRAYEIADEFRRRGVPVVLGGYHPSALPEEAKQHANSVVIGEAEISFPQLLNDLNKGELKTYYHSEPVDPKLIPQPRRDVIDYFLPTAAVEATRGCPVNCDFCFVHKIKGRTLRKRPIENVIEEIQSLKQRFFLFFDSSLTIDPPYTKTLFKDMIGLNKHFTCYGNVNVLAKDDELLKIASEAGCLNWCIGFESISQDIIDGIGKTTNKVNEYISAVKKIRDYNMNVTGSFVFGFDDHKLNVFEDTMDMLRKLDIDTGVFNILTPFPGTTLFDRIKKENRITTFDWTKYSCADTVFKPQHMTQKELYSGAIGVVKEFYSIPNTVKRVFKSAQLGYHPFVSSITHNILWFARSLYPGRD
jgi:radical SAM superfamily enzyme YgiQ (UPF0313 family)